MELYMLKATEKNFEGYEQGYTMNIRSDVLHDVPHIKNGLKRWRDWVLRSLMTKDNLIDTAMCTKRIGDCAIELYCLHVKLGEKIPIVTEINNEMKRMLHDRVYVLRADIVRVECEKMDCTT